MRWLYLSHNCLCNKGHMGLIPNNKMGCVQHIHLVGKCQLVQYLSDTVFRNLFPYMRLVIILQKKNHFHILLSNQHLLSKSCDFLNL